MKFITPGLISFLLTVIITPLVIRFATACNCLDSPDERRLHNDIIPRWGGVAFFAGVLPFLFIENGNGTFTAFIVASCILVGMGMTDDLKSLGWKSKLAGMAVAATIVIFGGDMAVHSIGVYGSFGRIELGLLSIPFTYIGIIGITNAINLLDGLDGLAGGVSLLAFLFMGLAATLAGDMMVAVICFAYVGALGAFLLYNFPKARIFMGDTGSLFLGFSLAVTALLLTQDPKSSVDSMFPVLVLLIPIFDTLRVLFVRLLNGKSPFLADNLHLHYLIVQQNISPVNVTLLFWTLTAAFGGIGLSLLDRPSMAYLMVALYASSFLGLFAASLTPTTHMRKYMYVFAGIVLLPSMVTAATDCQIIEYPDHIDAVCIGDEKNEPVLTQKSMGSRVPETVQAQRAAKAPLESKAVNTKVEPLVVPIATSMAASASLAAKAPLESKAVNTEDAPIAASMAASARLAAKTPLESEAVNTEVAPVAPIAPSMAASARMAVKARGAQPSVALADKEQVTGQADPVRFPVATGQPQNDMAAARVTNNSNSKGKGKISFIARMKNNLAVSSMAKH